MDFKHEHKIYAVIDLDALVNNYRVLWQRVKEDNPNATPICVVKANAYGHGIAESVEALVAAGANYFAVADISEAFEVRQVAPNAEILILGYTIPSDAPALCKYNIKQAVFDEDYGRRLSSAIEAAKLSGELPEDASLCLHIKLNTGMNRLGFSVCDDDLYASVDKILSLSSLNGLTLEGVFTHFACADMPESDATEAQIERFFKAVALLKERGLNLKTHMANSAGTIRYGAVGCDYARFGISLYGYAPSSDVKYEGLAPAMQLFTRVSQVSELKAGQSVSYGATYTAKKDMRIAAIAIGYADGLLRTCSGGEVIINGKKAKIIGRICMDQTIVDLGDIEASEGDIVTVYDRSGENLEALARRAGTIDHELLTLIGKRVYRKFKRDGR